MREEKGESRRRGGKAAGLWALEGVRSLKIELESSGDAVPFQSLGFDPRLDLTLANVHRLRGLAWGMALLVGLLGLVLTNRSRGAKVKYVVGVTLLSTLVPLVSGRAELSYLTNPAFYIATLLVPYYLVVLLGRRTLVVARRMMPGAAWATTAVLLLLLATRGALAEEPQDDAGWEDPLLVRLVEQHDPVVVPEDAIIVPYDPNVPIAARRSTAADWLLMSYPRFMELSKLARPEQHSAPPPVPYALAGANYSVTLSDGEDVSVDGRLEIDVFTDEQVAVPIDVGGGALTHAELDGAPARLGVTSGREVELWQWHPRSQANPRPGSALTLLVQGKGHHTLSFVVRLKTCQGGGWTAVDGRLPAAPATALTLHVPQVGTVLRLAGITDRLTYETVAPGERIETTLGPGGRLGLRWRPRVHEGQVDSSLTVHSSGLLDVREDGLRLIWQADLEFGRSERESFIFAVPAEYLIEEVSGVNVRGWVVRDTGAGEDQQVEVSLLEPVRGRERVVLVLHHRAVVERGSQATFAAPVVRVLGAALHSGRLTIRRSPLLELSTLRATGVSRIDTPEDAQQLAALVGGGWASPLGIRPHQAYRFAAAPFTIELKASAKVRRPGASVQTVLRIGERRRGVESRINVDPAGRPLYQVHVALPVDMHVEQVSAPGAFEWSLREEAERKVVSVYLTTGQKERFSILVRGNLGEEGAVEDVALPRIAACQARYRRGEIVVQVDPAFEVRALELDGCREIMLRKVHHWLTPEQRSLARLALRCDTRAYSGTLHLSPRSPRVACSTISNVRVTDTTIEETVLLDFSISKAGVRSVSFLLPSWMKDARITVPMLRQKSVTPVSGEPDAAVRVQLVLQDEVMGDLRVLVEHDRSLTPEVHLAPIPTVETGSTLRRSVTLESAGRDEVIVQELVGLRALSHRQQEWRQVSAILGSDLTQAYIADADEARLAFKTRARSVVRTAGARIGLAQAVLVLDEQGTYRATQSYRIDNSSERFLEVELPAGAELWSVLVAGEPVKPARVPGAGSGRRVRIPLAMTAAGDLDYEVRLSYGGKLSSPGGLRAVDFPLISTVNVSVELSQVQLHVPDAYRWFDFGGTMRRVADEGELLAGYLRYQTRLTERLAQTMESGSDFDRARAAASFGNLRSELGRFQQSLAGAVRDADVLRELRSNELVVQRAEEQLQQIVDQPQAKVSVDNRGRLGVFFQQQRAKRARNVVEGLDYNFEFKASTVGQDGDGARSEDFSQAWLDSNSLSVGQTAELADSETRIVTQQREAPPQSKVRAKPAAPEVAQKDAKKQLQGMNGFMPDGGERMTASPWVPPRRDSAKVVERYRQQLAKEGQVGGDGFTRGVADELQAGVARAGRGQPRRTELGVERYGMPVMAMGLASLSVELPVRGRVYRFTTPRGEVAISARAVSNRLLGALEHSGVVVLAIVVGAGLFWIGRHGRLAGLAEAGGATVMIVLGVVSMITGVLPVIGLAAVVFGAVLRARAVRRGAQPAEVPVNP